MKAWLPSPALQQPTTRITQNQCILNQQSFFAEIEKPTLNIIWNLRWPQRTKIILVLEDIFFKKKLSLGLVYLKLASILLCCQEWRRISKLLVHLVPPPKYWDHRSITKPISFSTGDLTQGCMHARQKLYQLGYLKLIHFKNLLQDYKSNSMLFYIKINIQVNGTELRV